jgi:hypothetical protein
MQTMSPYSQAALFHLTGKENYPGDRETRAQSIQKYSLISLPRYKDF